MGSGGGVVPGVVGVTGEVGLLGGGENDEAELTISSGGIYGETIGGDGGVIGLAAATVVAAAAPTAAVFTGVDGDLAGVAGLGEGAGVADQDDCGGLTGIGCGAGFGVVLGVAGGGEGGPLGPVEGVYPLNTAALGLYGFLVTGICVLAGIIIYQTNARKTLS